MHQRGMTHPLYLLAVEVVRELEKVGHLDFDHPDYFPFNEGIAITTVYCSMLEAEEKAIITLPEA